MSLRRPNPPCPTQPTAAVPSAAMLQCKPRTRTRLGLTIALSLATAGTLAATDLVPPAVSATAAAPAAPAVARKSARTLRYTVVIEAPETLRLALEDAVDLVRWQHHEDMTENLFDRLAREALRQATDTAAAEGWFSAQAEITVDHSTDPETVTLSVDTGAPTRIAKVEIALAGPAATDPAAGAAAIATARDEWLLPVGTVFRQAQWSAAKQRAVADLAASPYAAARISASQALIDPEARNADLSMTIDSGPAFHFGTLAITGLQRYDSELVRNFSPIRPGDLHSARELDRFVRRLGASGYFASAHASIDPEPATADAATVNVAVIEGAPKRLEVGLGYSTDTEIRANLDYSDVDIDGHGLQFYANARLEQKVQNAALRFVRPPDAGGWLNAASVKIERTDIENLITHTAYVGLRRESVDETDRWAYGGAYLLDQQSPSGAPTTDAHALFVDVARTWRRTDDLVAPTRGFNFNLQVGAGIPGASTEGFGRVVAQAATWYPLGQRNELSTRAQLGAVIADNREGVPSPLLFRTGGDTTVRGYEFESLGVKNGNATVPGRYLAVASVEAMRWFGESWGLAAFVDAGNAADAVKDLKHLALGYGTGLRLRTPIGPFRLDLAYGEDTHRVRVHFSVGLSF